MFEFFSNLLDTTGFPPRRNCGTAWTDLHAWTHILADLAIFAAYASIPVLLVFFVLKRKDVPFLPVFWLFAAFILACGVGHLVEATIFWHPWYRLSGLIKVVTAIVSWLTVVALVPVIPRALTLPGLSAINSRLQREIAEREAVEKQLRGESERLQRYNVELERFSENVVEREDRVIELKHEVNSLLRELGRDPRYLTHENS